MGVQIQGDTGNVIATKGTYSGNVTIGGTLTYEDVTNIDAVGVITARSGIDAASNLLLKTGGSEKVRINSGGKVLIGHTSARGIGGSQFRQLQIEGTSAGPSSASLVRNSADPSPPSLNLGKSRASSVGGTTIVQVDDALGTITFAGADGTNLQTNAAEIRGEVDGTPGENDMPGRLVFKTTSDGNASTGERLRITSGGRLIVDHPTGTQDLSTSSLSVYGNSSTANGNIPLSIHCGNVGSGRYMVSFYNGNGHVGSIITSGSTTTYETTSDYRLKENAVAISDGITRLKTLKPYRFNFKSDSSTTVDGFFAHEVTAVPEATSGTKDAVVTQAMIDAGDSKEGTLNDPIYQGIDQSKLVPLLTAALQEEISKREALETRIAALEG